MFGWLKSKPKTKSWKTSPSHLLLLSKFTQGETPDRFYNDENWASALNEPPADAIQRMSKEGMLQSGGWWSV